MHKAICAASLKLYSELFTPNSSTHPLSRVTQSSNPAEHCCHIRAERVRYRVWVVYLAMGTDVVVSDGLRAFRRCLSAVISLHFVATVNVMFEVIFTAEWFRV